MCNDPVSNGSVKGYCGMCEVDTLCGICVTDEHRKRRLDKRSSLSLADKGLNQLVEASAKTHLVGRQLPANRGTSK